VRANNSFKKILLYRGIVDFRKWIAGLAVVVEHELKEDLMADTLFVFVSRDRKSVKLLYWNKTGVALWTTKLDSEKFHFGRDRNGKLEINSQQLDLLLSGCDISKFKTHKESEIKRYS
jgi:transposase